MLLRVLFGMILVLYVGDGLPLVTTFNKYRVLG